MKPGQFVLTKSFGNGKVSLGQVTSDPLEPNENGALFYVQPLPATHPIAGRLIEREIREKFLTPIGEAEGQFFLTLLERIQKLETKRCKRVYLS